MQNEETIQVRDLRDQDWVWTSKFFLFHERVDEKMYKVYSGLAAHADNTSQSAYPGINTLARKLHMGRTTVIRAIQNLEKLGFISVERKLGGHNVYSLLKSQTNEKHATIQEITEPEDETPKQKARQFFDGILDLRKGVESEQSQKVKELLRYFVEKNPNVSKNIMWQEVQSFERYWTEKNSTGKKERWEKQETFEVDRRLVTWFSKKKDFSVGRGSIKNIKQIV